MSHPNSATDEPHTVSSSSLPLPQTETSPLASAERLAVLSKTLFHSPEIHHVFPLQIRGPSYSDVALIGERHVEIKEIIPSSGRFRHIATRADFDTRICAAGVLGQSILHDDANSDNDATTRPLEQSEWPPQALLLVLASRCLVLMTMKWDTANGTYEFVHTSIHLPIQSPYQSRSLADIDQPVDFIAVDPYSRAFATASRYGTIFFCGCAIENDAGMPTIHSVRLQRLLTTDMIIARMDFLFPPEQNGDDSVYLLVTGTGHQPFTMEVFTWHCGSDDTPTNMKMSLPPDEVQNHNIPLMLIPLQRTPGAFIITCDKWIAMYTYVHDDRFECHFSLSVDQFLEDAPLHTFTGITRSRPVWRAWCRPHRRTAGSPHTHLEDLYLVREDGLVCFFQVGDSSYSAAVQGILPSLIESAYNHDGRKLRDPDGIVYGGSLSDGGIYEIGRPRNDQSTRRETMSLRQTETLYNWAPFLDVVTRSTSMHRQNSCHTGNEFQFPSADQLFGTSGTEPFGALSQLRYGYEAIVDDMIEVVDVQEHASDDGESDSELDGVNGDFSQLGRSQIRFPATRMWAFELRNGTKIALVSWPRETILVVNPSESTASDNQTVRYGGETVAARHFPPEINSELGDLVVRVENERVSVVKLSDHGNLIEEKISVRVRGPILVAAISSDCRIVAAVSQTSVASYFIGIDNNEGPIDLRAPRERDETNIESDATCATIFHISDDSNDLDMKGSSSSRSRAFAAVGVSNSPSSNPQIKIFEITRSAAPDLVGTWDLGSFCALPADAIANSLTTLENFSFSDDPVLICGLRNGLLLVIKLSITESTIKAGDSVAVPLGHSGVEVTPQNARPSSLVACCDNNAMHLDFSQSLFTPKITYIWFTNPADRSEKASVELLSTVITDAENHTWKSVAAFSQGKVLFASLSSHPKPLPLKSPIYGTPTRALYSENFKCFFVVSKATYTEQRDRYLLSQIYVVHNDRVHSREHSSLLYGGEPGQSICWLMEWTLKHGEDKYVYLVATTQETTSETGVTGATGTGTPKGSIIYFQYDKRTKALQKRKTSTDDAPIYAICQYDEETAIYCTGSKIKKIRLSLDTQRYRDRRVELRRDDVPEAAGSAHYIVAHRPFITVSFTKQSVKVFRLDGDRLRLVTNDDRSRQGLSHVLLAEHNLLLATNKNASVRGLRLPSSDSDGTLEQPFLEAKLPVSITRISQLDVRPPWKRRRNFPTMERNLLGTAPDGSLWMFCILREPTWRFLRFVQNLCMRDKNVCPFTDLTANQHKHIEPANVEQSDFHINADILTRLIDRPDSATLLADMLDAEPDRDAGYVDFDSAAARRTRFAELFDQMKIHDLAGNLQPPEGNDMSTDSAMAIIAQILESPF